MICSIEVCTNKLYARGLCRKHDEMERGVYKPRPKPVCSHEGCDSREVHSNQNRWCPEHIIEARLNESTPYTKGYVDKSGYRIVSCLGVKTAEHRLVMERSLGRLLKDDETVHHKDGNKLNNSLDNLELWSHSHPYGQRVNDKLLWARDFVSSYDNPTDYIGLKGSTIFEIHRDIPFVTGGELHTLGTEVYPGVSILMPGKHQHETSPPGGDAVIMVTDESCGWKNKRFTHTDFFIDIERKREYSPEDTISMMYDYLDVLKGGRAAPKAYDLPGVSPHLCIYSWQVLAVIEHRRYKQWESKWGGMYLFPRFAAGIAEGLWDASQASEKQKRGRPGVEWLEKDHGVPIITKDLMA